jgi:hypothetical protein
MMLCILFAALLVAMLNKKQKVQECDATMPNRKQKARLIKKQSLTTHFSGTETQVYRLNTKY